jgi:hypothetical protein
MIQGVDVRLGRFYLFTILSEASLDRLAIFGGGELPIIIAGIITNA